MSLSHSQSTALPVYKWFSICQALLISVNNDQIHLIHETLLRRVANFYSVPAGLLVVKWQAVGGVDGPYMFKWLSNTVDSSARLASSQVNNPWADDVIRIR
jgi:hypothetical protein